MIGTKLAHYEITSHLGSGGMGDVYQATDTKLGRSVAIKFLPEAFSHDGERVARFQREARALASLNHSNIAAIHGLEVIDRRHFLVMELVAGETLADRIKRGAIPTEEALSIAKQIAEALEEAHKKGIVHRDLKPANIKVTSDRKVKVLDFGLAKMLEPASIPADLSQSPTLSAAHTMDGVILGTAAYMSPEQARGRLVDRRADIWAFGCVLYELLTGRAAFGGDTTTDIIGSIVKLDPDWQALPLEAAHTLSLLRRCLQKDVNRRLQHIADGRIELEEMIAAPPVTKARPEAAARKAVLAGWIAAVAAIGVAIWSVARTPGIAPFVAQPAERLSITVPKEHPVALTRRDHLGSAERSIAISPDGRTVVYVASAGEHTELFSRRLDSFEVKVIPKTEGAFDPFFSPDGKWIGFFTEEKLKKVAAEGGEPTILCDARIPHGGSWSPDGTIVFADSEGTRLVRVSSNGGPTQSVASSIGGASQSPAVLPDGKSALLSVFTLGGSQIVLVSLDSGKQNVLTAGVDARYVDTGHIIFIRGSTLMAAPIDLASRTLKGSPEMVLDGIRAEANGRGQFALSASGTLVYVPGAFAGIGRLGWVDRAGGFDPLQLPSQLYGTFTISHDGHRLSLTAFNPLSDIWIYDFDRAASTRLTTSGKNDFSNWTRDDKRVSFLSEGSGRRGVFWKAGDGSGPEELIANVSGSVDDWSPDGKYLTFTDTDPRTSWDIWMLPLSAERKPKPFLNSQYAEWGSAFSPDGRYLAYISDESGRYEIYVTSFPDKKERRQISTAGGEEPRWSRDGRELFYRYGQKWFAADIQTTPEFKAGKPHLMFEGPYLNVPGPSYDVSPDGKRFLVVKPTDETATTTELNVVLNWIEELKQRVRVR